MTDQTPEPGPCALTPIQLTRLDYARRDLAIARATNLTNTPKSGMVLLIATITRRLDDMVNLADELGSAPRPDPGTNNHP